MSKKIVIIEDEADLSIALSESLSQKGFLVRTASSGEEGLELISQDAPDIVLLDSMLPGISGLDVLESLREFRGTHSLPIIMLSNMDNPQDREKAKAYDIEAYLVKTDWRMEDIISKINDAL